MHAGRAARSMSHSYLKRSSIRRSVLSQYKEDICCFNNHSASGLIPRICVRNKVSDREGNGLMEGDIGTLTHWTKRNSGSCCFSPVLLESMVSHRLWSRPIVRCKENAPGMTT
ncbi:hypothetical protein EVAR_953_1 [Eumeta japonica]|uniref:Uncharacterized protein n=1 Tax=Eumeta variegata TaxID=151549 RepID=A0A4C1SED0_EUMVA|nr:hypothetical protein EVAR_953_1 [Eumeta japonica]